MTRSIPITIMRAGTSRGIFVDIRDLPAPPARDDVILRLFGSPDPRQIDGLGGADLLTSKVAIVGPPTVADADIDYTFGQVGIDTPVVDYNGNCGNISAGVGPYAITRGFVAPVDGITVVRIHNTNTSKILLAHVPVVNGVVQEAGDVHIDGVPGTGAGIFLDYSHTAGAVSESLLPDGSATQFVEEPETGKLTVSIVDFANPVVYVRADDLGLSGVEEPDWFAAHPATTALLERIRASAAVVCGLATSVETAEEESPTFPNISVVAKPQSYTALTDGRRIRHEEMDIVARIFAMRRAHKSYAGTGMSNLAAAAATPGTLVNEIVAVGCQETRDIRVGHPCGVAVVSVTTGQSGEIRQVGYQRTARLVATADAYL